MKCLTARSLWIPAWCFKFRHTHIQSTSIIVHTIYIYMIMIIIIVYIYIYVYIYVSYAHIHIYIYIKHITLVLNVSAVPAWNIFWLSFVELIEIWNQDTSSCAANGDDTICCLLTDPVEAFQCQDQCNTHVASRRQPPAPHRISSESERSTLLMMSAIVLFYCHCSLLLPSLRDKNPCAAATVWTMLFSHLRDRS